MSTPLLRMNWRGSAMRHLTSQSMIRLFFSAVKWRIAEPKQFIRNNGVDFRNRESRLSPVVQASFNEEITRRDVKGVLSSEREKIMNDVKARLADEAKSFGIEIVDVRIKRVDFVADISDSVYRRMARKKSLLGSSTITSDLDRKVAR